jgi:cyclophilin family peptidyl-prolyl cis-trans isomerase
MHREFVIELAPVDLMPHSVHLFLSQIAEGFWSRGAVVLNPGHVLQACPHPCLESVANGGKYPGDPYFDMKSAGIDSVSFQEYHPKYPHEKYTVGLAGRPHSGPEFYINLTNNTLDHGPVELLKKELGDRYSDYVRDTLGANSDDKVLAPDPCFGKVVKGFEVVDKMAERMTWASLNMYSNERRFDDSLLVRPVRMVSVTILDSLDSNSGYGKGSEEHSEL